MFLLDTNVLIYYARGDASVSDFFVRHERRVFYLPTLVVVEFLSYPLLTSIAIQRFKEFADQTIILDLDFSIAERAAELRRMHNLKLADGIIAASALTVGAALVTRNIRDFKKVRELRLEE